MAGRYERERAAATAAVREAARLCRAVQGGIDAAALAKKDKSPVTVADFGSQALVCRAIGEMFTHDPIIAEEDSAALRGVGNEQLLARVVEHVGRVRSGAGGDEVCRWIDRGNAGQYSPRFWTLDPIDGTKGFLRGEQYAIALALIIEGEVTVAALGCPNLTVSEGSKQTGAIFTAVKGEGAFVQPLEGGGGPAPVKVSNRKDTAGMRFCESVESGHTSHSESQRVAELLGIRAEPVRMDSQAKYAVVARGEADIYLRLPTRAGYVERIWDHAAGVLVVTEAGGKATDVAGRPLEFRHGPGLENNRGVVVSNGPLHGQIIEAIAQVGVK